MIFPDKFTSFNDSILSKIGLVFSIIAEDEERSIFELYNDVKKQFNDLSEYLIIIDILFMLEKIDVDFINGVISYVEND